MTKVYERQQAIERRMRGESIPEIAMALDVSKASVSLWLRGIQLPAAAVDAMLARQARNRLFAQQARRLATHAKRDNARIDAAALVSNISHTPESALIICSLMYWCEGAKSRSDSEFTFTNAEPLLVRGFLALLRNALPLDERKFRVRMHLHEYHDEKHQRTFWSSVTGIPKDQFSSTYWKPNTGTSRKEGYPGCIHLRYYDVTVARKIAATARAFLANVVQ